MPEKMHLFGLLSPIFHPAKVKEDKDTSRENRESSLLLSLLSPLPPCAPRYRPFSLRTCARGGERGKEGRIDAPASTTERHRAAQVGAGSKTSGEVEQPSDPGPTRRHGAASQAGQGGQHAKPGSFPASPADDRDGNGQEGPFCLLRRRTRNRQAPTRSGA